ncbi:MAG: hypothetical protein EOO42_24265 [Flavobacteriales bacterium]|nr:MAG: hypothetical protein EOO42_24265 [Flavobacteriales bacterium]
MINTHDQAHTYNKRLEQSKQLSFTNINSLNNVAPFYSIKLQAFNRVLEMQISSINKADTSLLSLPEGKQM